ncbi:MAG: hypothetical protein EOP62_10980 [Sphingomonadales bacterium]|nr:MAG: hypothetical protein EOP62_10980 [Sphingomonadales bacterium]
MKKMRYEFATISLLILLNVPVMAQPVTRPSAQSASEDVPDAVVNRVRLVAERSERLKAFIAEPRSVFIGVDLIRSKGEGDREPPPLYRARHYRYSDDVTVTSLVDLESGRVVDQIEMPHVPVPLTPGEFSEARALALRDDRIAPGLRQYGDRLVVEPLMVRTGDSKDPWFGQRVVRLLFRVGRDYLSSPVVYVNLSKRVVILEEAHRGHGDMQ